MLISVIAGFCIDFIKNGSFSLDNATRCSAERSQLQTSFQTCAVAQIIIGPGLNCFLIILNFYQALNRQDLAWNTYLFSVALYQIVAIMFEVSVLGGLLSNQGPSFTVLFGMLVIFLTTEAMNNRARWKARASVAEDEKMYQEIWELVEKEEKPCKTALNEFCSSEFTCNASDELLQDCSDIDILYSQAEFMNDAFQSLVSGLVETSVDKSTPKHSFAVLFPVKDIEAISQNLISDADSSLVNRNINECHGSETATQDRQPKNTTHITDYNQGQIFRGKTVTTHSEDLEKSSQDELQSESPRLPNQPSLSSDSVVEIPSDQIEKRAPGRSDTTRPHIHEMNGSTSNQVQSNQAKPALTHSLSEYKSGIPPKTAPVLVRRGPVKLPYRAIAKVRLDVYILHSMCSTFELILPHV